MSQINIRYDIGSNYSNAKKVTGETNYFVGASKICPICNKAIIGYPALSRKDNRTEICSNCGTLEAIQALINYKEEKENEKKI